MKPDFAVTCFLFTIYIAATDRSQANNEETTLQRARRWPGCDHRRARWASATTSRQQASRLRKLQDCEAKLTTKCAKWEALVAADNLNTIRRPRLLRKLLKKCNISCTEDEELILTGVYVSDTGYPNAIEVYSLGAVNLRDYSIGVANGGGGRDGQEPLVRGVDAEFPAGIYVYISNAERASRIRAYFGRIPAIVGSILALGNMTGKGAVELYKNGTLVDVFGRSSDGTGKSWEYARGWAYRTNGACSTRSFLPSDWKFSGVNATAGAQNVTAVSNPWPMGTFTVNVETGL